MARYISVVTFAFSLLFQASGKTNISSDLSFDCTNDNSMKIFVSKPGVYGSVYAQEAKGTKTCPVENHKLQDSDYFEIKNCNINETIRVIIMHVIQNGSADDVVIGGENVLFIDLKCNEVPLGGYVFNRTVTFNKSADKDYTLYTESPLYLVMEIQDSKNARLNDAVIVGAVLHLVITGGDQFVFRAESCIARDAEHKHSKTLVSNGLSMDTHILSNFINASIPTVSPNVSPASQHNHSLEATLYAFHFTNSHDVEIMCIITVCQKEDDTCSLQLTTKSPVHTSQFTSPKSGRKRRDALGLPQTQTLRTSFRVVDKFEDNNGIMKTSGAFRRAVSWLPLVFLAICAVRTLI